MSLDRRTLLAAAGAAGLGAAGASSARDDPVFAQDFDELWRTLSERYGFFGEKAVDWARVRAVYRPLADAAVDREAFAEVVRRVLAELYDPHTHLSQEWAGAPRWPPYDLLVEPDGSQARVVAVQDASAAARASLVPGDRIVAVDGRAVRAVAETLAPLCLARPDPAADFWALNVAVAGRRGEARTFGVARGGSTLAVEVPLDPPREPEPDLSHRRLEGGFGYIRIASFGDMATVARFDAALAELRDAPGLILDVRRNGGGDTAVARPIMGRFIEARAPYALMRRREGAGLGPPWTEYVEPRGPFAWLGPVVVLTDPWSASMAEGFPMGLRSLIGARIVGTPMMGLGAAVFPLRLDRTGIELQYSAEPVYAVDGTPRWRLRPDVETQPGADILAAGVAELARMASN